MTVILIGLVVLAGLYFFLKQGKASGVAIRNLSVEQAKGILKDNSTIALDVRTPAEIKAGKIEGAAELNVTSLQFVKGLEKLDKSKTYVVYCRSGKRSLKACQIMASHGFDDIYNMEGGYLAYK